MGPKRLRLAFFLPSLAAGGAEKVMLFIAGALSEHTAVCNLVLANPSGRLRDSIPPNIEVVDLFSSRPITAVSKLRRYLIESKPDALISSVVNANIAAGLACLGTNTPYLIREANHVEKEIASGSRFNRIANQAMMRIAYSRADRVIALTEQTRDSIIRFARINPALVRVIPNPIRTPSIPNAEKHGRFGVIACGRLDKQKDFSTLLRAFSIVAARDQTTTLTVIGEGPLKEELVKQAADLNLSRRIQFVGFIHNPSALMAKASIFVLSSRYEGFPNVLLEALSSGCGIVSTDCSDAVHQVLKNGAYGRIVPVGDPECMAEAIADLGSTPFCHTDLEEHLHMYRPASIVDQYLATIFSAIQSRNNHPGFFH